MISESSVGSGLRRLEAYVGIEALRYLAKERALALKVSDILQVPTGEIGDRVSVMLKQLREAEKEIARYRAIQLRQLAEVFVNDAEVVGGVTVVAEHLREPATTDELRTVALDIREHLKDRPAAIVVTALANDKPIVVAAVNEQGRARGLKAGDLVRTAAKVLKGGGGGKPDIAQGGGTDPLATGEALNEVRRVIGRTVTV